MNILFVATEYPKRGQPTTGFPNYLYRVSLALIQLGHKPIILAAGEQNSYRVEQNIEIWTVSIYSLFKFDSQTLEYTWKAIQTSYKLNQRIKKMVKELQIDIIQFTSLSGVAMFYHGKIPAVLRLSSYAKTYFSSYQTCSKSRVKIMSTFELLSARKCKVIFSPCKNTAIAFERDCHRSVKVIETPFVNDVQQYDYQFFETYLQEKKYVLFFGTLYAEKGILIIAEILEKFLRENLDFYFVFIGDDWNIKGENVTCILRKKAGEFAERVIISNSIPHKKLYPVIMHAAFIVLPSLMDNMPNTCIESMYFKKVVIGTRGASFEQLIKHGSSGLLCKIGDSKDLLDKMQIAVSMGENEKLQMGMLARKRINRLKPEYAVNKLLRLYEYVITHSK